MMSDPTRTRRIARVVGLASIAADVLQVRLEPVDGGSLPAWQPGAHIDVMLPSGLVRAYSLCGSVEDLDTYTIAVLRQPDGEGGSLELHRTAKVGAELSLVGPRNRFALEPAPGHLFLAGGIGITPMVPMVRELHSRDAPWRLLYGAASRMRMAFLDDLIDTRASNMEVWPQDERGFPDLRAAIESAPYDWLVYCCGPQPMIDAATAILADLGQLPRLRVERFTRGVGVRQPIDGEAFEVILQGIGVTVTVPADRSILEVVREIVPDVLFSCQEGDCGTCETAVLDGVPDHRDLVLTEEEREACATMMICVSRSLSPQLTLDI